MHREDERAPRRQVRFEEDERSDSEDAADLRRGLAEQAGRQQAARPFSEKPAAYQREPDRHQGHNHLHNHGPTVDAAVIKLLTYKEVAYPLAFDAATLAYGLLMVGIAFLSYQLRESIIIEEIYEKFQANREKFLQRVQLSLVRLVPELIKSFSICAYDVLVIMYLVKPIKASTKEERELTKSYQELLKKLSADRANVQENVRKLERMQATKSEMMSHRYTSYNAIMLQQLKLGLSLDFILASLTFASFFVTAVRFANQTLVKPHYPMFPFYFETILSGAVLARMALIVVTQIGEPGYGFRKAMVLSFVGIYTFGKLHENFSFSAYHEEQGQAVGGMAAAALVYLLARLLNEGRIGQAMRKVLYWLFVGDLKTDVRKAN